MRVPGEGPHEVGIDRKSNGAGHRRLGPLLYAHGSEVAT
jgi:hypothetical protein